MKKGTRVYVRWMDISADLHTDEPIEPVLAESVGWIVRDTKKVLELETCRYPIDRKKHHCKLRDGIAIPRGCVESVEPI